MKKQLPLFFVYQWMITIFDFASVFFSLSCHWFGCVFFFTSKIGSFWIYWKCKLTYKLKLKLVKSFWCKIFKSWNLMFFPSFSLVRFQYFLACEINNVHWNVPFNQGIHYSNGHFYSSIDLMQHRCNSFNIQQTCNWILFSIFFFFISFVYRTLATESISTWICVYAENEYCMKEKNILCIWCGWSARTSNDKKIYWKIPSSHCITITKKKPEKSVHIFDFSKAFHKVYGSFVISTSAWVLIVKCQFCSLSKTQILSFTYYMCVMCLCVA